MKWLLIAGAAFLLLSILYNYLVRTKCPQCKSRNVIELSRKEISSEPKLFKETVRLKEYDNKYHSKTNFEHRAVSNQYMNPPTKIITQEVIVEGKRTWYKVRCRCAKCNNIFSIEEYIDTKPEIEK